MAVGAQVGNVSSNPAYIISQSSSYPEFNNNLIIIITIGFKIHF